MISSYRDLKLEQVINALNSFKTVKGRMNVIQKDPFYVIVDFAHTPNSLKNALKSIKSLCKGKIIVVFGAAGQRDKKKRPQMGKIAAKYADITILTAEDPRFEKLKDINDQIVAGWSKYISQHMSRHMSMGNPSVYKKEIIRFDYDDKNVQVRRDAIKKALELAAPQDCVLICGKGHEQSLCFGSREYPWSDIRVVRELLIEMMG